MQADIATLANRAIADGDTAHADRLFKILWRVIRSRIRSGGVLNDPDDLTQIAVLRVWEKRHQYDPARPFLSWALVVARSAIASAMRSDCDRLAGLSDIANDVGSIENETPNVWELMRDLSDAERADVAQVFGLAGGGMSVAALARRTGRHVGQVNRSVSGAMRKMRTQTQGAT